MSKRSAPESGSSAPKKVKTTSSVFPADGALKNDELLAAQGNGSWAVRAHVANAAGEELSLFVRFTQNGSHYSVDFALADPAQDKGKYLAESIGDKNSVAVLLDQLNAGSFEVDDALKQALTETLEAGNMPLPNRQLDSEAKVGAGLDLTLGPNSIKDAGKGIDVCVSNADGSVAFELNLQHADFVRAPNNGSVQTDTFSAFTAAGAVTGTVTVNGVVKAAVTGKGTFERRLQRNSPGDLTYLVAQLADGSTLVTSGGKTTYVGADGKSSEFDSTLEPVYPESSSKKSSQVYKSTSTLTGEEFPSSWKLSVPAKKLELDVVAAFANQEIVTCLPARTSWVGRMVVSGTQAGVAFLEQCRVNPIQSFEGLVGKYAKAVIASIDSIMPREPTLEEVENLMSEPGFEHFMHGVSREVFRDCIISPLRDVIDRGSTSWRSLVTLLCIEAAGQNSAQFKHWLAMPEIMHVGSLIVDDIEDEDEVRRGGPASHVQHGLDIAINAGTAAYFMSVYMMMKHNPALDHNTRLNLYESYFVVLRAGHTGQALDMAGLHDEVEKLVGGGDTQNLMERALAIERLKNAVPSSSIAKMGALAAGGNSSVQGAIAHYVEAVGLAASLVRAVHNMTEAQGKRPQGKDLSKGKVTVPFVHAIKASDNATRASLLKSLKAKDSKAVIAGIQKAGGDKAALSQAEEIITKGWKEVDAVLPASWAKVLLRTFGLYSLTTSQWEQ